MSGHIFQLNASGGGVPKQALQMAEVDLLGLKSDSQAHPKIHGGPERALCLYSLEKIVALQQEGHPIYPGAVGENVTITGIDWREMRPGARLRLGAVTVELTTYTTPCNQIAFAFHDRNSNRIEVRQHAEWARLYCRILQTGTLTIGDAVTFIP